MIIFKFLLLLILFPSIASANEKYLDPDYTEGQQEIIKWPEKTGELKKIETKLTIDVLKVFNLKNSVNSKKSYGGTSFDNIKKMIMKYKKL